MSGPELNNSRHKQTNQKLTSKLTALVTGASTGIGQATALRLAEEGFLVYAAARRFDRLEAIAQPGSIIPLELDITDDVSVANAVAAVTAETGTLNTLVNNAGGAFGLGPVATESIENWNNMYQLNVLGTFRMVQAFLPALLASERGDIVNLTSIAAYDIYQGGVGYNAAKFGQRALSEGLRQELLGQPIRVIEVIPGAVHTEEFSLNRFEGDQSRADSVYQGFEPLQPEDIADAVAWAVTRKHHVNIDKIRIQPRAQLNASTTARNQ